MDANGREWIFKDAVCAVAGAAMDVSHEWVGAFWKPLHQEALKIQLEE